MKTPWQQVKAQQRAQRQEESLSKEKGGHKQVNSGRHWFAKRDVRLNGFLLEARTTEAGSYTIKQEEFEKIVKDALATPPGLLGAMQIDFHGLRLFVMKFEDHIFFQEYVTNLEAEVERLKGRDGGDIET